MLEQTMRQKKAGLEFEAITLVIIILAILGVSAWFQQDEYIIGMGIGVSYTIYAFFIYFRWKGLK